MLSFAKPLFGLLTCCGVLPWAAVALASSVRPAVPAHPQQDASADRLTPTPRIRPQCPIRIGGILTMDLGGDAPILEESAHLGTKLSNSNRDWIAANCDLVALNAVNIQPDTFPTIRRAQRLFTPLLYLYATSLYEQSAHSGNVGGWRPDMAAWTLKDSHGIEVPHPDPGGHWMDFGNIDWAAHWRQQAVSLIGQYHADGVVAADVPIGNSFVTANLQSYKSTEDRASATASWLETVHKDIPFLLVPSAVGFDALAGHPTLPPPVSADEPELHGRLWDEFNPMIDGGWAEGWIHPYWAKDPLPEKFWEIEIEAAERYSFQDQVFIAAAAYRNSRELEFDLASFLLAAHRQGRFVFQPMPILPGRQSDAGFSLAVLRNEVQKFANYFNVPLGFSLQQRHLVPVGGGSLWRRAYENGVVYVNSSDDRTRVLRLGGPMKRLDGTRVRKVILPPHTGAILLYISR